MNKCPGLLQVKVGSWGLRWTVPREWQGVKDCRLRVPLFLDCQAVKAAAASWCAQHQVHPYEGTLAMLPQLPLQVREELLLFQNAVPPAYFSADNRHATDKAAEAEALCHRDHCVTISSYSFLGEGKIHCSTQKSTHGDFKVLMDGLYTFFF